MLRGIDEIDGPGVYIRNVCKSLFQLDRQNQYFLFYRKKTQAGRFADAENVVERILKAPNKLLWDQLAVPIAAARDRLHVLFHHKFTIPILSPCPTVVQQRGAEFWRRPEWYSPLERFYTRMAIPLYCRRASKVLTNSNSLAEELAIHAGVNPREVEVIYAAPDPRFRRVDDEIRLDEIRKKYHLPHGPFFLMVAKGYASVDSKESRLYPGKNVQGTLRAYQEVVNTLPYAPALVVAGPGFEPENVTRSGGQNATLSGVIFPGFVAVEDMPALYTLATGLIFPSYWESFGIPLVEAMACECPVIGSTTGACPEVIGDAGILVDPNSPHEIALAMMRIVNERSLVTELRRRGLKRAAAFSWDVSAQKLLSVFREVVPVRLKS